MKLFSFQLHIRDKFDIWFVTSSISRFLFKKNLSLIFNRAVTRAIIRYYDGDAGHQTIPATGNMGYGFLHYSFIINTKPKHILCIGSRKGFIPAICALACAENGFGHVDFVDAGYGHEHANHWSGIGWWKQVDPKQHYSFLQVNQWLTSYIMTTTVFAKRYSKRRYNYIYIDGDHSYRGVKRDWSLFWPKLVRGGFIVLHDVAVHHTKDLGNFGAWKLWKTLSKKHAITFTVPTKSGLGIIQKT